MGPSRDGVLIPSDFGTSSFHIHRKRSTAPSYRIIVGVSDRETEELFSEEQLEDGLSEHERKRLLRTLVRNTYMHHLNEIFYTVENEYSPTGPPASGQEVRAKVAEALGDKLYTSPALETASWCNESGYTVHLYVHPVLETETEPSGGMLPLVFGLPFAPEISAFDFQAGPAQALVSQRVLTFWANFAHSGDPNSPRSRAEVFPSGGERPGPQEAWRPYTKAGADYLLLGEESVPPSTARTRPPERGPLPAARDGPVAAPSAPAPPGRRGALLPSAQHLPRARRPGARGESWPARLPVPAADHRAAALPRAPGDSLRAGHSSQESLHNYHGVHNATLVKIEEASTAAYNKAIYLILLIGFLMLGGNVWFWLCFVIRRQGHSCCGPGGHTVGKDISCETELVTSHSSTPSLQGIKSYYQTDYPGPDGCSKPGSDGLLRKRSLAQDSYGALSEGHSISFISNGSTVAGRASTVELVPCLKSSRRSRRSPESSSVQHVATLPRPGGREERPGRGEPGEGRRAGRGSGHGLERTAGPLARSSSQGDTGARPCMSTFCHVLPPPLPDPPHDFQPESV